MRSLTSSSATNRKGPGLTPVNDTGAPVGLQPVKQRRLAPGKVLSNALLIVLGFLFLAPLLWLLFSSVDSNAGPSLKWPHFTFSNYAAVANASTFTALENSTILAGIATIVATVPAVLAAYVFSRHHFPVKNGILLTIVVLAGVPINILVIPVFQAFSNYGLLNITATAFFLGVTSLPFEIWIIKTYIDAIPPDMEEAARLERANVMQTILRVIVPMTLPGIVAAAIFGFINAWGNFLVPFVLLSNPNEQPAPVVMYQFFGNAHVAWGSVAAYSVLYALPVLILYIAIARLFRGGFSMAGAIRG
jgi:multiple sugar transport system permease protein